MANTLFIQGMNPIPLHPSESFNKVRTRIVDAQKKKLEFEADTTGEYILGKDLSFFVDMNDPEGQVYDEEKEPGRISVNVDRIIAVVSDSKKDVAGE